MLSFKVFTNNGYSNEETVIEGFLKAFESGVSRDPPQGSCPRHGILKQDHYQADIISASLGEPSGFTANAWAVVASRMVDQGVVVVIAAGNDGEDGPFSASNGASGQHVVSTC